MPPIAARAGSVSSDRENRLAGAAVHASMRGVQPASYAAGVRGRFQDLPSAVVEWVAGELGGPVTAVRNAVGGFSPGVAAVVSSPSGRALFVKAVGAATNAEAVRFYSRERDAAAQLPHVDGIVLPTNGTELEVDGQPYVVLVFPALDGAPPRHPWRAAELDLVLAAQHRLSQQLTPSPWSGHDRDQRLPGFFCWWPRIIDNPDDPWHGSEWVASRAAALVAAELQSREEVTGGTLSHTDLRADNLVLDGDRVWFVDWAHAANAAPWVDATLLMADVVASHADLADGGEVDVIETLRDHPALAAGSYEQSWRLILAAAGALHGLAAQPSPPGLPTLRGWQAATSQTWLRWCLRTAPSSW